MGTVPSPPPPQRQYAVLRDDDRELVRVQRVRFDASGPLRSWRMLMPRDRYWTTFIGGGTRTGTDDRQA
jgi:hypothetical protein